LVVIEHHLLKEDIFKEQCLYCGNALQEDQFKTEHILHELLYKVAVCECGKEVIGDERVKHLI